jgi:hypothetical protein
MENRLSRPLALISALILTFSAPEAFADRRPDEADARKERVLAKTPNATASAVARTYQFDRKKKLNMNCELRFNPTIGSGCNY